MPDLQEILRTFFPGGNQAWQTPSARLTDEEKAELTRRLVQEMVAGQPQPEPPVGPIGPPPPSFVGPPLPANLGAQARAPTSAGPPSGAMTDVMGRIGAGVMAIPRAAGQAVQRIPGQLGSATARIKAITDALPQAGRISQSQVDEESQKELKKKKFQLALERLTKNVGEGLGGFSKVGPITAAQIAVGQREGKPVVAEESRQNIAQLEYETLPENDPESPISKQWQKLVSDAYGLETKAPAAVIQQTFPALTEHAGQQLRVSAALSTAGAGGKSVPPTSLQKLADQRQALKELDIIITEASDPKFQERLGPISGRWVEFERWIGTIDPDDARFLRKLKDIQNRYIRAITGAQMSIHEARRILGALPEMTLNPAAFMAVLQDARRTMSQSLDELETLYAQSGYQVGEQMTPDRLKEAAMSIGRSDLVPAIDDAIMGTGGTQGTSTGEWVEMLKPDGTEVEVHRDDVAGYQSQGFQLK